jgi:hypothetical protein
MTNSTYSAISSDQWLLHHAANVTSLSGEDGILEYIFTVIPKVNSWCVEFGAWDGKTFSNTYNLIANAGWKGVFIEADPVKFQDLLANYRSNSRVKCVNCFVTFEGQNSLDNILQQAGTPKDFDLLSIDIDGNDYHVWESLREFSPRVVVIEYNQTIPSHVEFIQPRDMNVQQGNAPLSLVKLGKSKGYDLICVTEYNLIFVRAELLPSFDIADNRLSRLRPSQFSQPHIFQLFDGTFVVGGMELMFWHGIPIRQDKFQILPKMFRHFPARPSSLYKRILKRIWLMLYRNGL